MKAHQRTVGKSDTWLTPRGIWSKLGSFDLDPACPDFIRDPIAPHCFTKADDGLKQPWHGRVWLNPPFNRYERPRWMAKMADHGNGIMLIPAATETEAFKRYVWDRASAVCFLHGRPHFLDEQLRRSRANCGCSIALVAYDGAFKINRRYLEESGLGTTFPIARPVAA